MSSSPMAFQRQQDILTQTLLIIRMTASPSLLTGTNEVILQMRTSSWTLNGEVITRSEI